MEINLEDEPEIAAQAGVTGTPTVQLFYGKELKSNGAGFSSAARSSRRLKRCFNGGAAGHRRCVRGR